MFRGYELWQYYSSSDSEGDEMAKTRTGTELGPPMPEGPINTDGGVPDTSTNIYTGTVNNGTVVGYTPRRPADAPVGGRETLRADTIVGVPSVTSHAPAGIGWIPQSAWDSAVWNGVPFDPTGKTKAQICNWVFPTSNTMRGLWQLYEANPPFANPASPTQVEIDFWNIKVINHFRSLFGIGPIEPSLRLYQEAQWSTERRWTSRWNGNNNGSPYASQGTWGPCPNGNPHCGAVFLPTNADQLLNSQQYGWLAQSPSVLSTSQTRQSVAEGLGGTNTNIPWSIKLGRVIAQFLCYEGLVGHTGPFLRRQKVGMIWHDLGDGTTQVRFKWGGTYTPFNGE